MNKEIDTITREVLEKISPTSLDHAKMERIARELELRVKAAIKEAGIEAKVRIEGSLAKDTWLKDNPDVDIFMRLPKSIPKRNLGEMALRIARKATDGTRQIERFAEHPYLEAFVDDVRLNIVPCYHTKLGEWLSATDRTPYHTDYINVHLDKNGHNDVRLLKQFMKGIGIYGAEIKVGGFSGYLCELLVLHWGSFIRVIETFAKHIPRRVIDIEGYYKDRRRDLELLFPESFVVVDPVDKARNVASAVQPQNLHIFSAASLAFLKEPSGEFFFPLNTHSLSLDELLKTLKGRGSSLIFLCFGKINVVPDVLWGQLHRTRKAIRKQFEIADFSVLRDAIWSEENSEVTILVFEIEQPVLAGVKKHLGPPLEYGKECESFLQKYIANDDVVAGPFIDNGRWVVEISRKFTDAAEFLRDKVGSGGRNIGVAELISEALRKDGLVLVGEEITEHYIYNAGFASFLTDFVSGKPFWLETKYEHVN
jgi:tRNA nucleotidyltransferase (CCA-adding enzyme)